MTLTVALAVIVGFTAISTQLPTSVDPELH
jgi:hypothetical protein